MEELERIIYLPQLFQKLISPNLIRADSSGRESQTTLYRIVQQIGLKIVFSKAAIGIDMPQCWRRQKQHYKSRCSSYFVYAAGAASSSKSGIKTACHSFKLTENYCELIFL